MPKEILVLGSGFAGLWAALGAARQREALGIPHDELAITVVSREPFHGIRVRYYEPDLSVCRIPLAELLDPVAVDRVEASVEKIDPSDGHVQLRDATGSVALRRYDRLVFALGSQVVRPNVPGLAEHAFDIDTYGAATALGRHLESLANGPSNEGETDAEGRWTAVVLGGGLTGIEVACELPARLRAVQERTGSSAPVRVLLLDRHPQVGSDMGDSARPVIEQGLAASGVTWRGGADVVAVTPTTVRLASGETIATQTVICCAGMRANARTSDLGVERDRFGRVEVDEYLRVRGVERVFAAGDVAWFRVDGTHSCVMSCQHARPMGRFSGYNAVADLFGHEMLPLRIDWYTTILDLGPAGAVYTEGWERRVVRTGAEAKATKRQINGERIYPPRNQGPEALLAAAAPVVQTPPPKRG